MADLDSAVLGIQDAHDISCAVTATRPVSSCCADREPPHDRSRDQAPDLARIVGSQAYSLQPRELSIRPEPRPVTDSSGDADSVAGCRGVIGDVCQETLSQPGRMRRDEIDSLLGHHTDEPDHS